MLPAGGEFAASLEQFFISPRGAAAFLRQLFVQVGDFCAQARFQIGDGRLALGQLALQVINLVGQLLGLVRCAGAQAADFIVFMAELGFKLFASWRRVRCALGVTRHGFARRRAFLLQLLVQRGDLHAQARFQVGDGSLALGQLPLQVINLVGQLLALLNGAGAQAADFIVFMAELGFKLLASWRRVRCALGVLRHGFARRRCVLAPAVAAAW